MSLSVPLFALYGNNSYISDSAVSYGDGYFNNNSVPQVINWPSANFNLYVPKDYEYDLGFFRRYFSDLSDGDTDKKLFTKNNVVLDAVGKYNILDDTLVSGNCQLTSGTINLEYQITNNTLIQELNAANTTTGLESKLNSALNQLRSVTFYNGSDINGIFTGTIASSFSRGIFNGTYNISGTSFMQSIRYSSGDYISSNLKVSGISNYATRNDSGSTVVSFTAKNSSFVLPINQGKVNWNISSSNTIKFSGKGAFVLSFTKSESKSFFENVSVWVWAIVGLALFAVVFGIFYWRNKKSNTEVMEMQTIKKSNL
ncbi:hypothetical protein HK103_007167 [Boothiomyces macroporosus]|uniref:Uncharacterized protein n=1 Tax=Boothiomyces macroporosus TaxID=261099 RepID=A0AAD5UCU6_9FUNG|nr:hypothetical protein HK103_007167 [Boothiomyces macroporosus]